MGKVEELGEERRGAFKKKQMGVRWWSDQQQPYSKWGTTMGHVKTKKHTHIQKKKKKSYGLAKRHKAPSLSPHLLPANATGLQAGFTCQSHTNTHTQTLRHTHIPSAVCHESMTGNWLWWHADNKQTDQILICWKLIKSLIMAEWQVVLDTSIRYCAKRSTSASESHWAGRGQTCLSVSWRTIWM